MPKLLPLASALLACGMLSAPLSGGITNSYAIRHLDPPPFQTAAARGDLDTLRTLLNQDPSLLQAHDDDGNTALHHAAWNGQVGIARFLLAQGVSPDVRQEGGSHPNDAWTPLCHAATTGQLQMIKLLLENGAKPDTRDKQGATPLHHAAQNGQIEAARLFLNAGVPADVRRTNGRVTPLEMAAYYGREEMVRLLLAHGADPNAHVYEGNTPLHQATRTGRLFPMALLVQAGANLESQRDDGQTPIHVAALSGQTDAVRLLLGMGANPLARAKNDEQPLATAIRTGQNAAADVLRQHLEALNETERQATLRDTMNRELADKPGGVEALVYRSNFSKTPDEKWQTTPLGAAWSDIHTSTVPETNQQYLGNFGSQEVRLSLPKLPPHTRVRVAVLLYVLNSWDGNWPGIGPDIWEAGIVGGPTLMRTTFCNGFPTYPKAPLQAFPSDWPGQAHVARTGAVAKNTMHVAAPPGSTTGTDATYKLGWTFAHTAPYLVLRFAGHGLENLENESWGLGRVEVYVASPARARTKAPVRKRR